MSNKKNYHDVIVIGAGVSGIYQIHSLTQLGMDAILLEGDEDLGGTWYRNRYPGCRFDTESYTYAYSFSKELCDEWHWKERFSSQPENLKYLNFVADKFDLRQYMTFNTFIDSMDWDEEKHEWTLYCRNGKIYHARFVVTSMGTVCIPTLPRLDGLDDYKGQSFHSRMWPKEPIDLKGKRVGVIGVGATGIQIIQTIAEEVGELYVFQRRPNWSAPLNNSLISEEEMADIRERYDEIFAKCKSTASGMEHVTDPRDFYSLTKEERIATWDELYDKPGFAILASNFGAIFTDKAANKEVSDYIANRIRQRVDDPVVAEKLIPKDHGFGIQRLPLETNYFETYNRDNVHLVDIMEAPIERVTETGIQTTDSHYELDLIVYATGYDTITGSFEAVNPSGVNGARLKDKWVDGPLTYFGVMTHGFPNMLMVPGPQAASGGSNFPRAIEVNSDGVTKILEHAMDNDYTRVEAEPEAEQWWLKEVKNSMERLLMSKATKGWIIGENSNIEGRDGSKKRYVAYWGGGARFAKLFNRALSDNFKGFKMDKKTMNTKETRALVEQFNEAWVNNDDKKVATLLSDDVVQQYPPYEKIRKGREEVVHYLTAQPGSSGDEILKVETMVRTVHKLVVEGDTAVGFHNLTAEMRKGGTYSNEYVWRLTCANGKIIRLDGCLDRLLAMQQVGDKPIFHGTVKS